MLSRIRHRWRVVGGYREVIVFSIPLILSTGSWTIQHFVDRVFLTWYSPAAIAAAMPAGMINFTLMSFFIGTAAYIGTFVAQYSGAGRDTRIGPTVWQGLYFSLIAGLMVLPLFPLAPKIFALAGHAPEVQSLETIYFQVLIFGAFPTAASSALAGFFSGRSKTRIVMWVSFIMTGTNIILDYGLIFGNWGMPALGVRGAALATVISQCAGFGIYFYLMTRPSLARKYLTILGWKPEKELLARLIRYGVPNGMHYFLEMIGFTLFILLVGRFGTVSLAASNITLNINHLAFMPMMGLGMAVSILVGQRLGENRADIAQRTTWSTFHLTFIYMVTIASAYALLPKLFLLPYASRSDPLQFEPIAKLSVNLLKFVAFYCIFDTMNIIFSAAVKGAGDTRFVMIISVILSWTLMVIPSYIVSVVFHKGIYSIWIFATLYITTLGIVFLLRFLTGKWKTMRVIEDANVIK
jgi:MATE family multidrug resistance protein